MNLQYSFWGEAMDTENIKVEPEELIGPLNDIEEKHAAKYLFVKGDTEFINLYPRVAIIGTRHPSEQGIKRAQKITQFLVNHKVSIVSGLAAGIDTIAHKTSIKQGGRTIAVLGTPLNQYYPRQNKELQDEISKNHLLVSEFAPGMPVQRGNFPQRNRTMALLSHASVIIEAGKKSGTEHQGWEALRLGRPLFIMDSLVKDVSLGWPQKLVEYGAQPLSLDNLDILLESLPESQMVIQDAFTF